MNTTPTTTDIAARARQLYRRAGPQVDAATAARLRAARRQALEARPTHRAWPWMVPAGACAAALLAVVAIWQPLARTLPVATTSVGATSGQDAASDMLPPDADQTDPALYQHMGFYAWLANQPSHKSGHGR
jgi:hypothetical protein